MRFHSITVVLRMATLLLCARMAWPQSPPAAPADLSAGERTYRTQCAYCHGPHGEGGRGASLARPRLLRTPDDQTMFSVIENGIPDTEMPGHWLSPREIWQVVAFVHTLGRVSVQKIAGDPERGQKLYAVKGGCARCHTVNGRGGALGPDLTDIGARRSISYLRESLIEPEAAVPEEFLQLQLITRDGRRIAGVRVNEDTFSIQIRDLSDHFQSFFRTELLEVIKQPGKSPMPSYKAAFTAAELDDLVAYLDSLRGTL